MKTMNALLAGIVMIVAGCGTLNPNNTPLEDVGEVALRTVLFPLTLGGYEMGLYMNRRQKAEQLAYWRWYDRLSPEQQDREDRRQGMRMNAAAMMYMGRLPMATMPPAHVNSDLNPIISTPLPAYQPSHVPRPLNCTSMAYGNAVNTNCY